MASGGDGLKERARGALYGQAIGDALGTRYEFKPKLMCEKMVKKDLKKGFLPILGGGPFDMEPGQVTDDTELAMALARSLLEKGTYDKEAVARNYHAWFRSSPPDIGNTTRSAFAGPKGASWYDSIVSQAAEKNKSSLSNGCLMRISPLAIAGTSWPSEVLLKTARSDTVITNPNQITQDGVAVYCRMIQALINGSTAADAVEAGRQASEINVIRDLIDAGKERDVPVRIEKNGQPKDVNGDGEAMGYIGVALQWTVYELLSAKTFDEGLVRTVSRGGDTDTTGCIVGAALGARFGADAIPADWKKTVTSAKPRRLAKFPMVHLDDLEDVATKLLECSPPEEK